MRLMARLVWNELMILVRDSSVLFWIFLFPVFFMFMMLFAFGSGGSLPQQVVEIVDLDQSVLSRRFIDEIRTTFSATESLPALLRGARDADPVANGASRITIPENFGGMLEQRRPVVVAVTYAEDGLPAQLVVRVVRSLSLRFEADLAQQGELLVVRSDPRGAVPAVRFVHYALTGTMVLAMMSAGMTTVCSALAYRRERNGFKMLACMPLSAARFLLAMLSARLAMLVFAACLFVLAGQWLFGVQVVLTPLRLAQGLLVVLLGGAMLLALGTALGARVATVSGANFITGLVYIVLLFLSDLTMPISAMPPAVRAVMEHLPPALFVTALRRSFILAEGLNLHLMLLAEMTAWLLLFAAIAALTFRWHKQ